MRLCATLLLCAACARAEWPEINPKLKQLAIRKAVILPAEVTINKIGLHGSEGGLDIGERFAPTFYSAVVAELKARGVEVLPNPLAEAKNDTERYAVADLQSRYDNVRIQLKRKPGAVEKGRYTLGERVARFEPGAAADALVFLRGIGTRLTRGRAALAAATMAWGVGPAFSGDITIVDAHTGEVLAFLRFTPMRDVIAKPEERLAKNVRNALQDVPLPLPPAKH